MASWEIARIELAYFDSCLHHWFLRQECIGAQEPLEFESLHRRQAQQILQFTRDRLDKVQRAFPVVPAPSDASPLIVTSSAGLIGGLKKSLGLSADSVDNWEQARVHLTKVVRDGSVSSQHSDRLSAFLTSDFIRNMPHAKACETSLDMGSALELLSVLPAPPPWPAGAVDPNAHLSPVDGRESALPRDGPHRPQLSVGKLYSTYGDVSAPSSQVFGHQLEVEAAFQMCADRSAEWITYERRDYCKMIPACDLTYQGEGCFYRLLHGLLTHHIQNHSLGTHEASSPPLIGAQVSYRIPVHNSFNFLQVHLRPKTIPEGSLRDLCDQWLEVHNTFATPHFLKAVEEALHRFSLARFQTEAARTIRKAAKTSQKDIDDSDVYEILAPELLSRLPLESAATKKGLYSSLSSLGPIPQKRATEHLDSQLPASTTADPSGIDALRDADFHAGRLRLRPSLATDRDLWYFTALQVTDQQFLFLTLLTLAERQLEEIRKKSALEQWVILQAEIDALPPAHLQSLSDLISQGLAHVPVHFLGHRTIAEIASRCVHRSLDDDGALKLLNDVVSPSIPLRLSEYVGLGPIKRLTHADPSYYVGTIRDLETTSQTLLQRAIAACMRADTPEFLEQLRAFQQRAHEVIDANMDMHQPTGESDESAFIDIDNGEILALIRRQKFTFYLHWKDYGEHTTDVVVVGSRPRPWGFPAEPNVLEGVELHWPIQVTFRRAFHDLDKLIREFGNYVAYSFGTCTGIPYRSSFVSPQNPPMMWRNYLIVRYHGDDLSRELLEQRPPNALAYFAGEFFGQFGSFYVSVLGKGHRNEKVPLYRCRVESNEKPQRVRLTPIAVDAVILVEDAGLQTRISEAVFGNLREGDVILILAFDSWKQI